MKNKFFTFVLALIMGLTLGFILTDKVFAKNCTHDKNGNCIQCIKKTHTCCKHCKKGCKDCKQCCKRSNKIKAVSLKAAKAETHQCCKKTTKMKK